jgi:DNA replication protein DnaC
MNMTPYPELTPLLKALRLSGILDSLSVRNQEAIEHKLPYGDFLSSVLQDEIARRDQMRFTRRLKKSNMQSHKTLEQFDFEFNPKINRQAVMDLSTGRFIQENVSVLLVGPCGTGKSHIAQAIGHCALRQGHCVLFYTQTQLLKRLQAAKATGQYEKRFRELSKVPLLIIDDFGLKPLRSSQDEDIHDLIAQRYEQASTVVTSNLALNEWGDAFPNKLLGAVTIDRLRHGAYRVILEGESYRASSGEKNEQKGGN